jgi:hypothetical protein
MQKVLPLFKWMWYKRYKVVLKNTHNNTPTNLVALLDENEIEMNSDH